MTMTHERDPSGGAVVGARVEEGVTADGFVDVSADEFVDLVCEDVDWLRAEFEAIVAASWQDEPPVAEHGAQLPRPAAPGASPTPAHPAARHRPSRPGCNGWARQRSPPAARTAPPLRSTA